MGRLDRANMRCLQKNVLPPAGGLPISGESWHDVTSARVPGSEYCDKEGPFETWI
jgi:hypothetical protein